MSPRASAVSSPCWVVDPNTVVVTMTKTIGRVDPTSTPARRANSAQTKLERFTLRPSVSSRKRLVSVPWARNRS